MVGDDVSGDYVQLDGERCYRIANCHLMPDFFMTLASPSDHWMFLSSRGAVTAGRKNPNFNLFPYYSADKIIDTAGCTGPKTIIRCHDWDGLTRHWEPFSESEPLASPLGLAVRRNIYKNGLGNKVYLEEVNHSLGLTFRYRWTFGMEYGFVRTCWLTNQSGSQRTIELLDGLQNLMPCGLNQDFQLQYSNLGDAYKKNELLSDSQLGIYYLSSIPTDRAEPSEGLRATAAWQTGLDRPTILLSNRQLGAFRAGRPISQEDDIRAGRGAYFAQTRLQLDDNETIRWSIAADVNLDQTDVIDLDKHLIDSPAIGRNLQHDIERCQDQLLSIVSSCDGRQMGSDELSVQRHQSNTLFNVMRGGYPSSGYTIDVQSFALHVKTMNRLVHERHQGFLASLGESIQIDSLNDRIEALGDADLIRLGLEYLPLTFGRRHGDPTRPWNAFSIDIRNSDGSTKLSYQGNWRDIFQNWEALSLAYPKFTESMVFRFVNASTADGYNPYRVTSEGIEWECPEPGNPWSNIGYWGDHQIVYLLKLLQWSRRFNPDGLNQWLDRDCCVYAEIPYRIGDYDRIRKDPHHTIDFDHELDQRITDRAQTIGADGKLLRSGNDELCHATLGEKLLVPMLVKMTNFVPDGGIWLNTQRPEWNDANNAIVGNGLSMVTVCYLRRYLAFLIEWFQSGDVPSSIGVTREVADLLARVDRSIQPYVDARTSESESEAAMLRRQVVDALATAGSDYRQNLYRHGLSGEKTTLSTEVCVDAFRTCLQAIDRTIRNNRRSDGLYHSYNLLSFDQDSIGIEPLYEMLEGQVAVLSCGLLTPNEAVEVLNTLRTSKLYREDQQSYVLYPDRKLPRFIDKNRLSPDDVFQSELLAALVADGDKSIVRMDMRGDAHFSGDFRNRNDLNVALDSLRQQRVYADLIDRERDSINDLFERTFNHRKFTGRSGTFFGYEGLGSIYWHMVSKLGLAVLENFEWARGNQNESSDDGTLIQLREHYREIRNGIGLSKSPEQYGAFPSDPYSHTPAHAGVQQPGMTGQVKEDILCRFTELGVRVEDGILAFDPVLFEPHERLQEPAEFTYCDLNGELASLSLPAGSFAFTLCQTPIIYQQGPHNEIVISGQDWVQVRRGPLELTRGETKSLHSRNHEIRKIEVFFPAFDSA
tara:strand:- start:930611 stop:934075 length:3465 start_codon:yes stop_codon:yes gene_type:complete